MADPSNTNPLGSSIWSQIETSAQNYPPATYGLGGQGYSDSGSSVFGILSFYRDIDLQGDPFTGDYIPFTSASRNSKTFAIGVLPPVQNITGRLLDRSATTPLIQAGENPFDNLYVALSETTAGNVVTAPGYQVDVTQADGSFTSIPAPENVSARCVGGETAWTRILQEDGSRPMRANGGTDSRNVTTSNCSVKYSPDQLYRVLGDAYVRVHGYQPTPVELQFYTAQCLRETSGFLASNNFGQIGNRSAPSGVPEYAVEYTPGNDPNVVKKAYFNAYPTLEAGADAYIRIVTTRNPNVVQSARSGDALGSTTSLAQQGYFQEPVSVYYNNMPRYLGQVSTSTAKHGVVLPTGSDLPTTTPDVPSMRESVFDYQKRVKGQTLQGQASLFRFNEGSPYPDGYLPSQRQPVESQASWNASGSQAAKSSARDREKLESTDLQYNQDGLALLAAQYTQILSTKRALEAMANVPPLRMLINPNKFSVKSQKIVSDGNWSRSGPIIEFWGDDRDKISGSGQIAATYALNTNPLLGQGGPGLTRAARNHSEAWQNLQSLYLLYKNNGGLYLQDLSQQERDITLSTVGSVYLYYDNILYIGCFDSFTINQTDTKPFTAEYSFEFTVRAAFLLDVPDQQSYGVATAFSRRRQPTLPTRSSISEQATLPPENSTVPVPTEV